MSAILLPNRLRQQPQYNAPIHRDWLAHGLVVACNPAVGAINQVEEYKRYPVANTGGLTTTVSQSGKVWQGASGKYIDFGDGYGNATGITAIQILRPDNNFNFTFSSRSASDTNGIEIVTGATAIAGDIQARMNAAGASTPQLSGLADGRDHVVAVRWTPSTELAIWADNLTRKQSRTTSIPGSITASQNLCLHRRGSSIYTGKSGLFLYFSAALPDFLLAKLLVNPYTIYQAPSRRLWAVSAGGTTHDLAVAQVIQVNDVSDVEITQVHALSIGGIEQAQSVETPAISQQHGLTINNVAQDNNADTLSIGQQHSLSVANSGSVSEVNAIEVSQGSALSIASIVQDNAAESVGIAQTHSLTIGSVNQSNAVESVSVSQTHVITIVSTVQANTADSVEVSQGSVISISDIVHGNEITPVEILQEHLIGIAGVSQDNNIVSVQIATDHNLAVAQVIQVNDVSDTQVILTQTLIISSITNINIPSDVEIVYKLADPLVIDSKYIAYSYYKNYTAKYGV